MKEIQLKIWFASPAFLGNADQNAQWRTPPFKALLRQWWRVVKAQSCNYDHQRLLCEENKLFGRAAEEGATRSALRIKLSKWSSGTLREVSQGNKVEHPEVRRNGQIVPIGSHLYLGFGPITTGGSKSAIEPFDDIVELWLGFPECFYEDIKKTIQLMAWFGTIGSRSRNGWGSITVESVSGVQLQPLSEADLNAFCRDWHECLQREWAHAIGRDGRGALVWQTEPRDDFKAVMEDLANIKIGFRTRFRFPNEDTPHQQPQARHVISYPVTKHGLNGLKNTRRLANQIRFKVIVNEDRFSARIFHLPCKAPDDHIAELTPQNRRGYKDLEVQVWPQIHEFLDQRLPNGRLQRRNT